MATASNGETPRVQSAARALGILVEVASSEDGLTPSEIGARLELNRSTVYHLIQTLRSSGFLARADLGRYRLGPQTGVITAGYSRQIRPPEGAREIIHALAALTGEATYVAGWLDGEIVQLDHARGNHAVMVTTTRLGPLENAHTRASGKVLLAYAPADVRDPYLAIHARAPVSTRPADDLEALAPEWETIRAQGYAWDIEEYEREVSCIAAPLPSSGLPVAVSLSAPASRFRERQADYLAALLDATRGSTR
jgi:IclR family acetate operon transcriptional repressor